MPRSGAVTRSMTHAGTAALHSTSEQATSKGDVPAEITTYQVLYTIHESGMDDNPNFEHPSPRGLIPDSNSSLSSFLSDDILTQNRMTILRLEQDGILEPGILTIDPSGELRAALNIKPDVGTMVGLFPNITPYEGTEEQVSSWLRDYLIKILNVHGHGPPAVCRGFYDYLRECQDDEGKNHSVRTAESHLSYATISLRHAIEGVESFRSMRYTFKDTYEEEVSNVIRTIKRLIGYEGETMPEDMRMLIEIAEVGAAMKEALDEPLESLIITPYMQMLEKLELVSRALRSQLDRIDQEAELAQETEGPQSAPDSGIDGCWT